MSCSARPSRFRVVALTLATVIAGGLIGVGIACASPTGGTETLHADSSASTCCTDRPTDDTQCTGTSECQIERQAVASPSAVIPPSSCRVQPKRIATSFGAFGFAILGGSADPGFGARPGHIFSEQESLASPVSLHLLYSVFLN